VNRSSPYRQLARAASLPKRVRRRRRPLRELLPWLAFIAAVLMFDGRALMVVAPIVLRSAEHTAVRAGRKGLSKRPAGERRSIATRATDSL
jgi:hypothetical protein